MIKKLEEKEINDVYTLNELQIKERQSNLDEKDTAKLIEIRERNTNNNILLCGVEILLKSTAYKHYFSQLTYEEQENFKNFPIYYLTKNIS